MKKYFRYLTIPFLLINLVLISSCSDDENVAGHFTVNENTYPLTRGYFQPESSFTVGEDHVGWLIVLASNGIKHGEGVEFTGKGHLVVISLILKSNLTDFQSGTFVANDDDHHAYSTGVYINFNVETQAGQSYKDSDDATVILTSLSGNKVDVEFTLKFDGQTVTGNFKGTLERILE